jgi:short-subunit dehydrogenase
MDTVLITGASSGIGATLAVTLAERGVRVGLVGRRAAELEAVLDRCRVTSPASRSWRGDLGDLAWAGSVVDEAWDAFGVIDVLVNNAAIPKVRPATSLTLADAEEAIRINYLSPVAMTLRALPKMLERGSGSIVNVASMGGRVGIAHEAAYSASKFALSGFSESLAIDLADTAIRVRLIHPGPIDTGIWDRPGEPHATYRGPLEPPSVVADGIVAALSSDRFEHYFPDLKWVVDAKQADVDAFIKGSAAQPRR